MRCGDAPLAHNNGLTTTVALRLMRTRHRLVCLHGLFISQNPAPFAGDRFDPTAKSEVSHELSQRPFPLASQSIPLSAFHFELFEVPCDVVRCGQFVSVCEILFAYNTGLVTALCAPAAKDAPAVAASLEWIHWNVVATVSTFVAI